MATRSESLPELSVVSSSPGDPEIWILLMGLVWKHYTEAGVCEEKTWVDVKQLNVTSLMKVVLSANCGCVDDHTRIRW